MIFEVGKYEQNSVHRASKSSKITFLKETLIFLTSTVDSFSQCTVTDIGWPGTKPVEGMNIVACNFPNGHKQKQPNVFCITSLIGSCSMKVLMTYEVRWQMKFSCILNHTDCGLRFLVEVVIGIDAYFVLYIAIWFPRPLEDRFDKVSHASIIVFETAWKINRQLYTERVRKLRHRKLDHPTWNLFRKKDFMRQSWWHGITFCTCFTSENVKFPWKIFLSTGTRHVLRLFSSVRRRNGYSPTHYRLSNSLHSESWKISIRFS